MDQIKANSLIDTYGSKSLDKLIERLQSTSNLKRRYEYVLWLAKSLPILSNHQIQLLQILKKETPNEHRNILIN